MPLDTSIPLSGKPQDGLASLANLVGTANNMIGLQSNSQRLQANQVISKAYQEATDPQTGQVDFGKLQALATQGGAGAYLPEFMGQIAQQRNSQVQYQTNQLELALKQQTNIRKVIGSLMDNPQFGKGDMTDVITKAIGQSVANGTLPQEQGVREVQSIPSTPEEQAQWIRNHWLNSLSGEAQIQALLPRTQIVSTGGQTQVLAVNPMTGAPSLTGTLQNTMTPGEANSPVPLSTPGGTPYVTTKQQFANAANGVPVPNAQGYTGRYPTQAQGAMQPPSDVPVGGLQTGLSPAEQARQTAGATAQANQSATAAQDLHNAAADAPMRINLLTQARDSLANLPATGPGTDWRNTFESALNSSPVLGQALASMGVTDPHKIANYDEFKKILTNYATSVSGAVGTGTDARLNAAVTGNANPNISKMANDDILVKTMAAEKMRQAQDYAWQNSGNSPDKFNQWQSQWNKTVSPDAFAFVEMNPTQQQAFLARQQKAGTLGKFKADFGNMVRSGLISAPGGQ